MPNPVRCVLPALMAVWVALVLSSCGADATQSDAFALARHFDSLWVASGGGPQGPLIRESGISQVEVPAAFGAHPLRVAINTAAGLEHWQAFEYVVDPGGDEYRYSNVFVAYRDPDAHTSVVIFFRSDGSINAAALYANDSLFVRSTAASGTSATPVPTDRSCATPPLLENPVIGEYEQSLCSGADFSTSASLEFPPTALVDPALTRLSLARRTFAGEQFAPTFGEFSGH